MIKNITNILSKKGYIFSTFVAITPKQLGSRKQLNIYSGCDLNNHFISVFVVDQKSRFLVKNAMDLIILQNKLVDLEQHNFKTNILVISSTICSKAVDFLIKNGWKIYNDIV